MTENWENWAEDGAGMETWQYYCSEDDSEGDNYYSSLQSSEYESDFQGPTKIFTHNLESVIR